MKMWCEFQVSSDSNPFIYISTLLCIQCIIHMHISNVSNVILKYFHFVLLVVFFLGPRLYIAHAQQCTTFVNCFSSSMIMRFTQINNSDHAIFIYLFIYLCFGVSFSTVDRDLQKVCNRKMQQPTIPIWWQKKWYCSDMHSVVSAIDGTSPEIQIPSNEPNSNLTVGTKNTIVSIAS